MNHSHAFLPPLAEPLLDAFERRASTVNYRPLRLDLVSSLTGELAQEGDVLAADHWRRHLHEPVQFRRGMDTLANEGSDTYLEIGPGTSLRASGQQCVADGTWLASLCPERGDWEQLLESLASLYVRGADVAWSGFDRDYHCRRLPIPTYPFQRKRYWCVDGSSRSSVSLGQATFQEHPLLGRRIRSSVIADTVFEAQFAVHSPTFLDDHRVFGAAVVPGACFVSMALSAVREVLGEPPHVLEEVVFREACVLSEKGHRAVQLILDGSQETLRSFKILSLQEGSEDRQVSQWTLHASGAVRSPRVTQADRETVDLEALKNRNPRTTSPTSFYQMLSGLGYQLGPAFTRLEHIRRGEGEALGCMRWPSDDAESRTAIHPGLLDSCFQLIGVVLHDGLLADRAASDIHVPISIDRFCFFGGGSDRIWCHAVVRSPEEDGCERLTADLRIFTDQGRMIAKVDGLSVKRTQRDALLRSSESDAPGLFYEIEWQPRAPGVQNAASDLPSSSDLVRPLSRRVDDLRVEHGLAEYQYVLSRMEACSVGFILQAVNDLGWEWQAGERVSADRFADACGVATRHRRLAARMLEIIGEEGFLERLGSDWKVRSVPRLEPAMEEHQLLLTRYPACAAELGLLGKCGPQLAAVLRGERDALQLLFPDGSLAELEKLWQDSPWARLCNRLVQTAISTALAGIPPERRVRILEIGAGTGGTSAYVLPTLPADRTEYVFTDVSPQFTLYAEKKFTDYPFVRYGLLDIERSPQTQGFATDEFDIILAANVLHATSDLRRALAHVKELLAPAGLLILLESTRAQRWVDITYGLLEGWWKFSDADLRPSYPLLSRTSWEALLTDAGFTGVASVPVGEDTGDCASQALVLSRGPAADQAAPMKQRGRWIIFADEGGLGLRLANLLETRGEDCVLVYAGDTNEQLEMGHWRVDPSQPDGFARMLDAVGSGELSCRGVVHLWSLDVAPTPQTDPQTLRKDLSLTCQSTLYLLQALARMDSSECPRLWLVTRGAQRVAAELEPLSIVQSALWGLGNVIALEHPEFGCVRVDLPAEPGAEEPHQLLESVFNPDSEDRIAFRGGIRHTARLVRRDVSTDGGGSPLQLSAEGSYLITGGLGGLGIEVAQWLALRGARHIVLVGRGAVSGSALGVIGEMQRSAVTVKVMKADVSDAKDVTAVLSHFGTSFPPLRGLFHSAGLLDDGVLVNQTWSRFEKVMNPKVLGSWNLHTLTQDLDLDFFVLFSSAASLLGSSGQGNYAAANAFLDGLCHFRRALGLPALSINWGAWSVGMASTVRDSDNRRWATLGIDVMSPQEGLAALEQLLVSDRVQVGAMSIDWQQFIHTFPAGYEPAFLVDLAAETRSVVKPQTERAERSDILRILAQSPVAERKSLLIAQLQRLAADALGLDPSASLDPHKPLTELGLDSLMILELRNSLCKTFDHSLPSTVVFDYPTIDALSEYLGGILTLDIQPAEPCSSVDAGENVGRAQSEAVAIIGMSCRVPGAADPEAFWQLLRHGVDAITEVPPDRWDVDAYYDPDPEAPGKSYTRCGGFLEDIDKFDAHFFGIAPREAINMDPQQRLLLEVGWEALERAGQPVSSLAGSDTGVFVGVMNEDYASLIRDTHQINCHSTIGMAASMVASRLSYLLGLQGPALVVDTSCSSSLVAIHLARRSLCNRECNMALAGGVNLILSPMGTIALAELRALSPDGRCRTFDRAGEGFGRGEGCGVVVLKRLSDALADGDSILAIIRGSAVNNDGRSSGLTAPNGPAQERVIRKALSDARIEPGQISYVETHGTGTPLGDPIEVHALGAVFGEGRDRDHALQIGSVKTNIGHLESAAGIAGLIKVVLALQHREIPPHLHLQAPNPHIPWDKLPIVVPRERSSWQTGSEPRRAGVSSFGFSGTNAHVVLEEAPDQQTETSELDRPAHVLCLSAKDGNALRELAGAYERHLKVHPEDSLADVCFTANAGHMHFDHRVAVVGNSVNEMRKKLSSFVNGTEEGSGLCAGEVREPGGPKVAFLFSGDGSQYAGMGRQLYETDPKFREILEGCEELLRDQIDQPLLSGLYPPSGEDATLGEAAFAEPALFALEYALARLWRSWGVEAFLMMGHGVGAYVAACVAGAFSLEDGLKLAAQRGRMMQASFGDDSPPIEPLLDEFEQGAAGVNYRSVRVGLVSDLSGERIDGKHLSAEYWRLHLRQPAQFDRGMETLVKEGCETFLEIGPNPVLLDMGRRCVSLQGGLWLASLRKEHGDWEQLLESLSELYVEGSAVDWSSFDGAYARRCVELPTYPFQRQRYWMDAATSDPAPSRVEQVGERRHSFSGHRVCAATKETIFEHHVGRHAPPFLNDHRVFGQVVFPLAGYLEMALAGAKTVLESRAVILEEVIVGDALILSGDSERTVQLVLSPEDNETRSFRILSLKDEQANRNENRWTLHAGGRIRTGDPTRLRDNRLSFETLRSRCATELDSAVCYEMWRGHGLEYGPSFRGIERLWSGNCESLARISLADSLQREAGQYAFHPALLDACLQVVGAARARDEIGPEYVYLPLGMD
ncbi:MAG: SDR family NAD(P)-dependent oxidoreductase [Planctomycetes bacterium]|nr:SDR family NAD(P)-dependent oxidoreductase [Planctomycetota bacterium]